MALDKTDLENDLIARLVTPKDLTTEQEAEMKELMKQLAEAFTEHIKRGEVTITTTPQTTNVE